MVTITNNQEVPEYPSLRVYADSGNYDDDAQVLCADVADLANPICMFQAQFVRYGSIVYRFITPEELGEALYAIDPDSTHDAVALYKEELARDIARAAGTLSPSNPVPADTTGAPAPDPEVVTQDASISADTPDTSTSGISSPDSALSDTTISTEPAPVLDAPADATTTPQVLVDATSTEDSFLVPDTSTASTTPDLAPLGGADLSSPPSGGSGTTSPL
jgi:hypothetical protein